MFPYHSSHRLMIVALCSSLVGAGASERYALAATGDVVDLEADTRNNPPASTTDKSTPPPAATTDPEIETEKVSTELDEAAKEEAAEEKLKLRAGERVGNEPRGTAQVLGMSLQEAPHERVKVVEVAMNSPAFDAGVMKGDEIIAFQGFRGESYRKWIDGIRRLTTDTAAGLKIPVSIARDGERLTVAIEVPVEPVRPSTARALAQPGSILLPPALPATGGPDVAVVNPGNNVAIANSGPFGAFFAGQAATAKERAMAQIFRIGGNPTTNVAGSAAAGNPASVRKSAAGATTPIRGGVRIGLAGFRDDPSGMVVMVDVGALPPGNYTVGISDPSIIIGGAAATGTGGVNPDVQTPSQLAPPQAPAPTPGSKGGFVPDNAEPVPPRARQPQGSSPPASNRLIPRTVLAQVSTTGQSDGPAAGPGVVEGTIPPTGQVSPSSTNNAQQAQAAQATTGTGQNNTGILGGTLNQIGTITIDQSGTGRMQQTVESVRVRDVVGQAIVLYSQGGPPQTTLPANLDAGAGAATQQGASGGQGSAASQATALQQATVGTQVPVAGGIIQLVNDRRPPETIAPQTSQTPAGTNRATEQPASATPPAGQNIVR